MEARREPEREPELFEIERSPEAGPQDEIEKHFSYHLLPSTATGRERHCLSGNRMSGSRAVAFQHVFHQGVAAALCDHPRPLHQGLLGLDEIEPRIAPNARMNVRVHTDRIAGTSLHAIAAVNAAQGVDLVPSGIFFDLR